MAQDKEFALPKPYFRSRISVEEAIYKRRSQRKFVYGNLDLEQIGQLLWAAQGITARRGDVTLRNAPSAGALYPVEIYALTKDGMYHYIPRGHRVEVLTGSDLRKTLSDAALGQASIAQVPLDIVICAVYSRITSKYGSRGIRYVQMEAGHVAQNIHLQAVSLGLGSVPIGAFNDEEVKQKIGLPADNDPLYIIPVGCIE